MTDKGNEEDYVGEIKGGLRPTMRLTVMGIVHKHPKSMVVLVSCQSKIEEDEEIEGDVALELKVNFAERAVIRNARLSGQWGASETALSFFPFASGEPFKMEIVCEHQQFRIMVDGRPLCGFAHRFTQLSSLTALRVHGDLQLTKVA
ncbi:galectin-related protein A isoform X2 [Misgurnus anguillicaudatus]|uniref:galectin-related protein A isoform X2 n=1 Tax=Misgurnus anguillicaudatus TaxID=75329 RepID=UPI0024350C00|nr:galectin-related protein A-like isoform X2 [Misgurnus anguillicaudatus]